MYFTIHLCSSPATTNKYDINSLFALLSAATLTEMVAIVRGVDVMRVPHMHLLPLAGVLSAYATTSATTSELTTTATQDIRYLYPGYYSLRWLLSLCSN